MRSPRLIYLAVAVVLAVAGFVLTQYLADRSSPGLGETVVVAGQLDCFAAYSDGCTFFAERRGAGVMRPIRGPRVTTTIATTTGSTTTWTPMTDPLCGWLR